MPVCTREGVNFRLSYDGLISGYDTALPIWPSPVGYEM